MQCHWSSDQTVVTETPTGAVGCAILNDVSIAAGVASLPDPVTDIQDDIWMLFQGLISQTRVATAVGFQESAGSLYEVDSKAMRKLPEGKSVAFIVANGHPTEGAEFTMIARVYSTLARA